MRFREYLRDIPVDLISRTEITELISGWLKERSGSRQIITLNATMVVEALRNKELKQVIQAADLVTVDGSGVLQSLRKKSNVWNGELCTGVDLTRELLQLSDKYGYPVYFYGGTPRVIKQLSPKLIKLFPDLDILALRDGYLDQGRRELVIEDICQKKPSLLLVGIGSPEQEIFVSRVLARVQNTIGIGVGGAFDVLSGIKREAPPFFKKHSCIWAFRMIQDPRKLRKIPDLIRFWYEFLV